MTSGQTMARNGTRSHRGLPHGAGPSVENNECRAPPRRKPACLAENLCKTTYHMDVLRSSKTLEGTIQKTDRTSW